jgi:hypothetical protein
VFDGPSISGRHSLHEFSCAHDHAARSSATPTCAAAAEPLEVACSPADPHADGNPYGEEGAHHLGQGDSGMQRVVAVDKSNLNAHAGCDVAVDKNRRAA